VSLPSWAPTLELTQVLEPDAGPFDAGARFACGPAQGTIATRARASLAARLKEHRVRILNKFAFQ
jgi:hypothetical protein